MTKKLSSYHSRLQSVDKLSLLVSAVLIIAFSTIAALAYFSGLIANVMLFLLVLFLQIALLVLFINFEEKLQDQTHTLWTLPMLYGIWLLLMLGLNIIPSESGGVATVTVGLLFFVTIFYYPIKWLIHRISEAKTVVSANSAMEEQASLCECKVYSESMSAVEPPYSLPESQPEIEPETIPLHYPDESSKGSPGVDRLVTKMPRSTDCKPSTSEHLNVSPDVPETELTNEQIIERELKYYCGDDEKQLKAMWIIVEGRLQRLSTTQIMVRLDDADTGVSESTFHNSLIPTLKTLGLVQDPKKPHLFKLKIL